LHEPEQGFHDKSTLNLLSGDFHFLSGDFIFCRATMPVNIFALSAGLLNPQTQSGKDRSRTPLTIMAASAQ